MSERERFEEWWSVHTDCPPPSGGGEWEGWKARARIAEKREAELVRGLEAIRDYGDSSGRLGIYPEQHEAKYPEFAGDMEEAEIADAVLKAYRDES